MNKRTLLLLPLLFLPLLASAKAKYEVQKLWDDPTDRRERRPELRIFRPKEKKSNLCILICPGGSYHHLGLTNEGSEVAEYINQWGVVAVVLRYRVAMRGNHHPAMIEDFQRAMQILRNKSREWDISRIGSIGFSAGGHLVTLGAATHTNYLKMRGIPTDSVNLRPDFTSPIYPVISTDDSVIHQKSFVNLFAEKEIMASLRDSFSMEKSIPSDMPPVFLLACRDDDVVDYRNSEMLHKALVAKKIKHEYHLMEHGGHGFGMIRTRSEETKNWAELLQNWLISNNFLETQK